MKFHWVKESDLDDIYELERKSYPLDEAASKEGILFRIKNAAAYFLVAIRDDNDEIIGFINGTCSSEEKLKHETMSNHDKDGKYLCIHSVVIDERYRRKGLGTQMLKEYLRLIKTEQPQILCILLLAKFEKLSFYTKVGFENQGVSDVVHGQEEWWLLSQMMNIP